MRRVCGTCCARVALHCTDPTWPTCKAISEGSPISEGFYCISSFKAFTYQFKDRSRKFFGWSRKISNNQRDLYKRIVARVATVPTSWCRARIALHLVRTWPCFAPTRIFCISRQQYPSNNWYVKALNCYVTYLRSTVTLRTVTVTNKQTITTVIREGSHYCVTLAKGRLGDRAKHHLLRTT